MVTCRVHRVGGVALGLIALFALQAGLQIARSVLLSRVSQGVIADLRKRVYAHVQRLPISVHLERPRGDLISLMSHETERLGSFLTGPVLSFGPQLITLLGAMVIMVMLDPILAVPILLGIPLAVLLAKLFGRQFRSLARDWREAYAQVVSTVESHLAMVPAIKSFVRGSRIAAPRSSARSMHFATSRSSRPSARRFSGRSRFS